MTKRCLLAFPILVLMLGSCASAKKSGNAYFIQMADTQFGFFTDNKDFDRETVNFEKAIAEANRLRPTFVIVCGDLVHKPGDQEQIAEYKRIAALLDPAIPLYNVSGNHDVENKPTAESLAQYRNDFGPDYYSFKNGRVFGIVVNSSLMKNPANVPEEAAAQEEWLQAELQKAKKTTNSLVVVFMHHSLFLREPQEDDGYFNFPGPRRSHYLSLFKDSGVKYVFAGHYHRNAMGRDGDLEMVTSGPVGKPLGDGVSGFRIVVVEDNSLRHAYHSLDSIPEIVR